MWKYDLSHSKIFLFLCSAFDLFCQVVSNEGIKTMFFIPTICKSLLHNLFRQFQSAK